MSTPADRRRGTARGARLLSVVLSALILLPSDLLVAQAAAQVLGAAESAAGAVRVPLVPAAAGVSAPAMPAALPVLASSLSGPAAALSAAPAPGARLAPAAAAANASPWNPSAPTVLLTPSARAAEAALAAEAAPGGSGVAGGSGVSGLSGVKPSGLADARGSGVAADAPSAAAHGAAHVGAKPAAADAAAQLADAKDGASAAFDGTAKSDEPDLGWDQLPAVPAEAPNSLAEISLDVPPGAHYTPSPKDWRREIVESVIFDRYGRAEPHSSWGDPAAATTRHGGNIRGLIERLDYLKGQGATALIVNPVYFTLPAAYHNYWPLHFMAVDPHLGTMQDFKDLVAEAHKRGMRIVLDVVFNHSGPIIEYNEGYRFGDKPKTIKEWKFPLKPVELAQADNFHRRGSISDWNDPEQIKYGDFPGGLNHLATDRPATQDILLKIAKWWMKETDVDGFRLDTYMHVAESFWDRFHSELPAYARTLGKDNFLTIGEIYHGDARVLKPELAPGRLGAAFNYPSYFGDLDALHARAPTRKLEDRFKEVADVLGPLVHKLLNFVDLQDKPRFLEDATPVGLLRVAMAYVMFSVGIPFVYYGSEQAFRRAATNVDVGLDAYREDMFPGGEFRSMGSTGDDFKPDSEMYRYMQRITTSRKAHEALMVGEQYVRWSDPSGSGVYAFSRIHDGEEVVVVMNTAAEERSADMYVDASASPAGTHFADDLDKSYKTIASAPSEGGSKLFVRVPAHGVRVLVRQLGPDSL